MCFRSRLSLTAALCAALASSATLAFGQINAVDLLSSNPGANGAYELGFEFSTGNQGVLVTSLGYFDGGNQNTLAEIHDVNLWDGLGNVVAQANVSSASPIQSNLFAFTPISPVWLAPNSIYTVGGYTNGTDAYEFTNGFNFVTNLGITYLTDSYEDGDQFPDLHEGGGNSYFGANFQSVPEPSSVAFLGAGVGLLALRRRKKA